MIFWQQLFDGIVADTFGMEYGAISAERSTFGTQYASLTPSVPHG